MAESATDGKGRRQLRYESYDDFLADVTSLAGRETMVVGSWSFAQICKHLTAALHGCIDGVSFRAPLPVRVFGKLFLKKKFLGQTLPSGFKIPGKAQAQFLPDESADLQKEVAALSEAVERVKTERSRAGHPFLDQLTADEWDQFNLRHAELHMSFVRPASESTPT